MTRPAPIRHKVWRTVILCLVLVNLLFSVGEGLHLTPFQPDVSTNETSTSNAFTQAGPSSASAQLNPIELTRIRKGDNRHTTNAEMPPLAFRLNPATLQIVDTKINVVGFIGSAYDSPFAGRAPPSVS